MEQERTMKPFKTVKTEYYEEFDENFYSVNGVSDPPWIGRPRRFGHDHDPDRWKPDPGRRIKVVTRTEEWTGSNKDPVVETHFEYL